MELRIDPSSAVPIYAQVVEQIKVLIASRALRPGAPSPKGRDRLARAQKETGRPESDAGARSVKNFSPSRLDIKKGIFPSPAVSDGRPPALLPGSAGRPLVERAPYVTRNLRALTPFPGVNACPACSTCRARWG